MTSTLTDPNDHVSTSMLYHPMHPLDHHPHLPQPHAHDDSLAQMHQLDQHLFPQQHLPPSQGPPHPLAFGMHDALPYPTSHHGKGSPGQQQGQQHQQQQPPYYGYGTPFLNGAADMYGGATAGAAATLYDPRYMQPQLPQPPQHYPQARYAPFPAPPQTNAPLPLPRTEGDGHPPQQAAVKPPRRRTKTVVEQSADGWHCGWEGCLVAPADPEGEAAPGVYATSEALHAHVVAQHVEPTPDTHVCHWEKCNRRGNPLSAHAGLLNHVRQHTGQRPSHRCPVCQKSFTRKDAVAKHVEQYHAEADPAAPADEGAGKSSGLAAGPAAGASSSTGLGPCNPATSAAGPAALPLGPLMQAPGVGGFATSAHREPAMDAAGVIVGGHATSAMPSGLGRGGPPQTLPLPRSAYPGAAAAYPTVYYPPTSPEGHHPIVQPEAGGMAMHPDPAGPGVTPKRARGPRKPTTEAKRGPKRKQASGDGTPVLDDAAHQSKRRRRESDVLAYGTHPACYPAHPIQADAVAAVDLSEDSAATYRTLKRHFRYLLEEWDSLDRCHTGWETRLRRLRTQRSLLLDQVVAKIRALDGDPTAPGVLSRVADAMDGDV